jgi:hypothetical protein
VPTHLGERLQGTESCLFRGDYLVEQPSGLVLFRGRFPSQRIHDAPRFLLLANRAFCCAYGRQDGDHADTVQTWTWPHAPDTLSLETASVCAGMRCGPDGDDPT